MGSTDLFLKKILINFIKKSFHIYRVKPFTSVTVTLERHRNTKFLLGSLIRLLGITSSLAASYCHLKQTIFQRIINQISLSLMYQNFRQFLRQMILTQKRSYW